MRALDGSSANRISYAISVGVGARFGSGEIYFSFPTHISPGGQVDIIRSEVDLWLIYFSEERQKRLKAAMEKRRKMNETKNKDVAPVACHPSTAKRHCH